MFPFGFMILNFIPIEQLEECVFLVYAVIPAFLKLVWFKSQLTLPTFNFFFH